MDVGGEGVAAVVPAGRPVAVAVAPEVDGDGAEPFGGQTTGGAVPGVARLAGAVQQKHNWPIWVAAAVDGEVDAVGDQDLWQKAILGMACVANESAHVNQVLDQAVNLIQSVPVIQLVRSRIELL